MTPHQGVDIGALKRAMVLAAAGGLAFAALGPGAESQPLGDARRGELVAHEACGSCHAVARTGASRNPKAPAFRSLPHRHAIDHRQETLAKGLTDGHRGGTMPALQLEPGDIGDLLAHIERVAQR